MWVVRDYNGTLRLHLDKPVRMGHVWHTEPYFGSPRSVTIVKNQFEVDPFPKLKWTDNPIEVEFKRK